MLNRLASMLSLMLVFIFIAACSGSEPTATPVPTSTPTAIPSATEARIPQDNETVEVHYHGTLDNGEVFDSSREREPFSFVVGSGQVIAGFDRAVRKLALGETITVRLEPLEAYGERRDDYVLELPIDQLPEGLNSGDNVVFENGFPGVITVVTEDTFTVDANHRLAGQALTFEIELVSIKWQ